MEFFSCFVVCKYVCFLSSVSYSRSVAMFTYRILFYVYILAITLTCPHMHSNIHTEADAGKSTHRENAQLKSCLSFFYIVLLCIESSSPRPWPSRIVQRRLEKMKGDVHWQRLFDWSQNNWSSHSNIPWHWDIQRGLFKLSDMLRHMYWGAWCPSQGRC